MNCLHRKSIDQDAHDFASSRAIHVHLATPHRRRTDALEIVPGITETDLAGTGYPLRKSNAPTFSPLDVPQSVRLKATGIAGELQILLSAVLFAAFYEVESKLNPVNGPWTMAPAFANTRGMTLTGLTRGKDHFVYVRAVATGQNRGHRNDIANAMAV